MFERFTDKARKVLVLANQAAIDLNHEYVGTEHILIGLVSEGTDIAAGLLKKFGVGSENVRLEVQKLVRAAPKPVPKGKRPYTPRANIVLGYALEESKSLNHGYVGTVHLLLGVLREQDGVGAQVLVNLGLSLNRVREQILELLDVRWDPALMKAAATPRPTPQERFADHPLVKQYRQLITDHEIRVEQIKANFGEALAWQKLVWQLERALQDLYEQLEKNDPFA